MAVNTYVPLDKVTVSGTVSSITLTGISQSYTDLVLVSSYGSGNTMYMQFNNDTSGSSTNYSNTVLYGNGTSASGARNTSTYRTYYAGYWVGSDTTLGTNVAITHLQNYANTTTYKSIISRSSQATQESDAIVGMWRSTAAISSITIGVTSGNLTVGSTFALYGIAAANTTPALKATGGTIYADSTYYYHVFDSTGVFTPSSSLSADILVVAGGGAGGFDRGGGGGAGGLRGFTSQSLSSGVSYTCTVGAGGAAPTSDVKGPSGTASSFAGSGFTTINASGGGGGGSNNSRSGADGGSGGGASGSQTGGSGGAGNIGGYSPVEGYAGGAGVVSGSNGGGGGGAGAAGYAGNSAIAQVSQGGEGSSAYSEWILATGLGQVVSGVGYIAGGGAGNAVTVGTARGGYGGGGASYITAVGANAGQINTGSGGGGQSGSGGPAGSGGSGVIIVRYAKA